MSKRRKYSNRKTLDFISSLSIYDFYISFVLVVNVNTHQNFTNKCHFTTIKGVVHPKIQSYFITIFIFFYQNDFFLLWNTTKEIVKTAGCSFLYNCSEWGLELVYSKALKDTFFSPYYFYYIDKSIQHRNDGNMGNSMQISTLG